MAAQTASHKKKDDDVSSATNTRRADISPVSGKSRTQLHWLRKFFHALTGIGFAALYEYLLTRKQTLILYGILFGILVSGELLRMRFPNTVGRFALRVTQALARSYEKDHASGMVFFVGGLLFCVSFLPKYVAVLSILYLSIGDPVASACGIKYGYLGPKFSNGKSLIGYIGGLLACAITTYVYFLRSCSHSLSLLAVSLIGGFAGATMEVLCSRKIGPEGLGGPIDIDDNLAVPIGSGCIFYAVLAFGFPSFCPAGMIQA